MDSRHWASVRFRVRPPGLAGEPHRAEAEPVAAEAAVEKCAQLGLLLARNAGFLLQLDPPDLAHAGHPEGTAAGGDRAGAAGQPELAKRPVGGHAVKAAARRAQVG